MALSRLSCMLLRTAWIGVNEYIWTAVYFGSTLMDTSAYIPKQYQTWSWSTANKGKIVDMLLLGPIDSPHKVGDELWYQPTSPRGAPATLHRVISRVWFERPFRPLRPYHLVSGYAPLATQDFHNIITAICRMILKDPTL